MEFKEGDWVVFDLAVGQVKKNDGKFQEFSDGHLNTSGQLADRFRPLTLRNKAIIESVDFYYKSLREIDGERGFNYPDISRYFAQVARDAIDGEDREDMLKPASDFVRAARDYTKVIDGVRLFRRAA